MGHDEQRAIIGVERRLKRTERFKIKMISRLIEQEQRRGHAAAEHAGQRHPQGFAAAYPRHRSLGGRGTKAESSKRGSAAIIVHLRIEPCKVFDDRHVCGKQFQPLIEIGCADMPSHIA